VDGEVEVRVADTGPGVPAALRSRVFEPFYSTRSTGTGLGLAVAARIMAGHGGAIRLDDGARRGAAFCLRFPVPKPSAEA
jgi:signal transduction histidine kinase